MNKKLKIGDLVKHSEFPEYVATVLSFNTDHGEDMAFVYLWKWQLGYIKSEEQRFENWSLDTCKKIEI